MGRMPPKFLPKYATTVEPMAPRQGPGYQGYEGYETSSAKPLKSVAEILSEPLGEVSPNLGRVSSEASRQRQIADMLLEGANSRQATDLVTGFSKLGEAFIARNAGKRADAAEDKAQSVQSALMQQAMQTGPEGKAALDQLLANNQEYGIQAAMLAQAPPPPPDYGFLNVDRVGVVRTDPRTGETTVAHEAPPEPIDLPEGMILDKNGNRMWDPAYIEGKKELAAAGASRSNTSITMPGEKGETKYQEGLGTQAATTFGTIVEQGTAATAQIGNLDTMQTLLNGIDYTGFGGTALMNIQRVGAMLGVDESLLKDLPAKEAANRLSMQMALGLKTDLPGPMSNADREFLLSIPPNLNSTKEGNAAIIFILRKREERKRDMMNSLMQANPQSMDEMRAWQKNYLETTPPMFSPKTQEALRKQLGMSQ
jgi:hypothetical protein